MSRRGRPLPQSFADVERVAETLAQKGVRVWLFGGWAEERLGLTEPREHGDVDFLYVADDFDRLDGVIARQGWPLEKHLPHKRAVRLEGLTVDLFLVRRDGAGYYSEFDGRHHRWPDDVVSDESRLPVASTASVGGFRAAFERLLEEQRRQQKPAREDCLSADELGLLAAVIERLVPSDDHGPGAREANVLRYLEQALAGEYAEHVEAYRDGLVLVEERARSTYGPGFRALGGDEQDDVVAWLEGTAPGFFELLLRHVREGMFGDPRWGGNDGFAGWILLGYPGPRPVWTADEQQLDVQPAPTYPAPGR
jgi:hypothetical protein